MSGLLDNPAPFFQSLVLEIPAILLAVTLHEVGHAFVADRLGDPTARSLGRLTLNPFPHIDPLGALAFFVAGFGWAKPVPVNAAKLRNPRRDMVWVAVAGPLSNFVVAFVGLLALRAAGKLGYVATGTIETQPLAAVLYYIFAFNLGIGIFNLIPLPPLDGGHFLQYFAPEAPAARTLGRYGTIILLVLVISGATRYIVRPIFDSLVGIYLAIVRLIL